MLLFSRTIYCFSGFFTLPFGMLAASEYLVKRIGPSIISSTLSIVSLYVQCDILYILLFTVYYVFIATYLFRYILYSSHDYGFEWEFV